MIQDIHLRIWGNDVFINIFPKDKLNGGLNFTMMNGIPNIQSDFEENSEESKKLIELCTSISNESLELYELLKQSKNDI